MRDGRDDIATNAKKVTRGAVKDIEWRKGTKEKLTKLKTYKTKKQ